MYFNLLIFIFLSGLPIIRALFIKMNKQIIKIKHKSQPITNDFHNPFKYIYFSFLQQIPMFLNLPSIHQYLYIIPYLSISIDQIMHTLTRFINNNTQYNIVMIPMLAVLITYVLVLAWLHLKKSKLPGSKLAKKVAFFHPFCNDGGGGQKVLWTIIQALFQSKMPQQEQPIISIYSLQPNLHQILLKVSQRFNINLSQHSHKIHIIHLPGRSLLTPQSRLTMLCHIFLPMLYCIKCIFKYQPDIFYDTTGFAFNFIIVKILLPFTQCRAYVHYPFISQDMVKKIKDRRAGFNNQEGISKSKWKTYVKLGYYYAILYAYKMVRFTVKQVQANSTWTQQHMKKLWNNNIVKLYPPCILTQLLNFKKSYTSPTFKLMSLAQFRPQKNHVLQIDVVDNLRKRLESSPEHKDKSIHLYICGTTRGAEDQKLLQTLQGKVKLMKLQKYITFCVNMKFQGLIAKLEECQYGIHSMEAEHFGISVVEMLAAGCLIVAHNSAGPKFDIIKDQRFLAESAEQYEEKIYNILVMNAEKKKSISEQFRSRMKQFGEVTFKENFRNIFYANQKIKNKVN